MNTDLTWKGRVTRVVDGGGIEVDGKVVVVPQILLRVSVGVGASAVVAPFAG